MKKFLSILLAGLLVPCLVNAQVINWTTTIKAVVVTTNKVNLIVTRVSEPNPYGSTWDCTSDAVNIGDYNQSVSTSLKYSAA
ncbi:hypothetical protein, partial [Vibrio sp. S9_S30]|uniref:hypothetical protein n=1 Tax=Vibrio sp. S9_S30 TaxID=2720226 RepID=UPI001EEEC6A2